MDANDGEKRIKLNQTHQTFYQIEICCHKVEATAKMADLTSEQIQQDWENREFIEILSESIKNIAKFLNNFGNSFLLTLF